MTKLRNAHAALSIVGIKVHVIAAKSITALNHDCEYHISARGICNSGGGGHTYI